MPLWNLWSHDTFLLFFPVSLISRSWNSRVKAPKPVILMVNFYGLIIPWVHVISLITGMKKEPQLQHFCTRQRPPRLLRHPQLRLKSTIFGIGNPIEGKFKWSIYGYGTVYQRDIPIFISQFFNASSDDFKDGTGFKAWFSLIQLVILVPFCQGN